MLTRNTFLTSTLTGLAALTLSGASFAANLVQNHSFESGLANWTTSSTPANQCSWQALGDNVITTPYRSHLSGPPTDGALALITDSTSTAAVCKIYQDVTLPAAGTSTLSLAAGYKIWDRDERGAANCSVKVEVTDTNGNLITTVYEATGVNRAALAPQPAVNLTAQNGTTVRIIATATSCLNNGWRGVAGVTLDNVVLNNTSIPDPVVAGGVSAVPTLSEWALITCAALLGGITWLQRRRPAAHRG
ncbi:IPTL-CTERM sorting domain-containing protein [Curvibacter sp. HBC61]|uniref:IPTL-CTERM sorting domain-containing protein n=1 Tax=Curvibacter cyanobacteriorum TaxID=3026422 RepID=A0ABT5N1M6_9BURK|nr:IPTL-CTERM sorting domain-containing protein [Curvibacter sp. HBC61]MDD0840211.1 IPTL-CTERM sorting domain-containing protein [Curvibacter sp. HBC61]